MPEPLPQGAWFQAPTCRALGLSLELRMRNTARMLASGERQASERVLVELRAYLRGELVYSAPRFGEIAPGGSLLIRQADLPAPAQDATDEELLLVARVQREGSRGAFFSQEHQLVYTHAQSRAQAHILYDQQPARPSAARAAPIVFLMPKVWLGGGIATHVVVCNTWDVDVPTRQREPVRFSLLDQRGAEVAAWDHVFFYNEARTFDLGEKAGAAGGEGQARFFNLVGRGGSGMFVLFALVHNTRSNHFAIEHSLPPLYYMDGAMDAVREQGCDAALFRPGAGR